MQLGRSVVSATESATRRRYNVYCDESCHLQFDRQSLMVLGGIWCPEEAVRQVSDEIRAIKVRHGLGRAFEIKWTKVSEAKRAFYEDLIDYYIASPHLRFRAVVATGKDRLDHAAFNQDHDGWYWKIYYALLKELAIEGRSFRAFVDIKDTRSAARVRTLSEILATKLAGGGGRVEHIQAIRSHESEILQLADLLIGAVSYGNRGLVHRKLKVDLIERIERGVGRSIKSTTGHSSLKFNLLVWAPRETLRTARQDGEQ